MASQMKRRNHTGRTAGNILLNEGSNYLLDKAEQRGHRNRSQGAAIGGGLGALLGSFLGIPGAAVGAAIGGTIGGAIGESMD